MLNVILVWKLHRGPFLNGRHIRNELFVLLRDYGFAFKGGGPTGERRCANNCIRHRSAIALFDLDLDISSVRSELESE